MSEGSLPSLETALRRARLRWGAHRALRTACVALPAALALLLLAPWAVGRNLDWGWIVALTVAAGTTAALAAGRAATPALSETARRLDRRLAADQAIETAFELRGAEGEMARLIRQAARRHLANADPARLRPALWSRPPWIAYALAVLAVLGLAPRLGLAPAAARLFGHRGAPRLVAATAAGGPADAVTPLPAGVDPPAGSATPRRDQPGSAQPEVEPGAGLPRLPVAEDGSRSSGADPSRVSPARAPVPSPAPPPAAGLAGTSPGRPQPTPAAAAPDPTRSGGGNGSRGSLGDPDRGSGAAGGEAPAPIAAGGAGSAGAGRGSDGGGPAAARSGIPPPPPLELSAASLPVTPRVEEALARADLPPGLELYVRRYFEALARPR